MGSTIIHGMGGLGDALHQRAIVRALPASRDYWLETAWPSVYHDMAAEGLRVIPLQTRLRTQRKNMSRQAGAFSRGVPVKATRDLRVGYTPDAVRSAGSVLGGMFATTLGQEPDPAALDFSLPVPRAWRDKAWQWLDRWAPGGLDRPLMIYRPLTERTEWAGCSARNPDYDAYAGLLESIRERFFIVSVADLQRGLEWTVGRRVPVDAEAHRGELDFETLAGLVAEAAVVYSAPGFAVVLAQAVGTPSVCVFGGYEDGRSFSAGARLAPHLAVEPIESCACFKHDHACDKRIDLNAAGSALAVFVRDHVRQDPPARPALGGRPALRPTVAVEPAACNLRGLPTSYLNPGELERLITLVRSVNPRTMVEVGCNNGRTAKAMLDNVPTLVRYWGIDVPPTYQFARKVQAREVPPNPGALALGDPRFRLILARRGTFDLTPADFPDVEIGVVFIDGDHGAEAVRHDHALALEVIAPGGLIIYHDDHDLDSVDVRAVLDELHRPSAPIVHVDGTWLAYLRT